MVTVSAIKYVELGNRIESVRFAFYLLDLAKDEISAELNDERIAECRACLKHLITSLEELDLSAAQELVSHAYDDLPQTKREFDQLLRFVMADVKKNGIPLPTHTSRKILRGCVSEHDNHGFSTSHERTNSGWQRFGCWPLHSLGFSRDARGRDRLAGAWKNLECYVQG